MVVRRKGRRQSLYGRLYTARLRAFRAGELDSDAPGLGGVRTAPSYQLSDNHGDSRDARSVGGLEVGGGPEERSDEVEVGGRGDGVVVPVVLDEPSVGQDPEVPSEHGE